MLNRFHRLFHDAGLNCVPANGKEPLVKWGCWQTQRQTLDDLARLFDREECNTSVVTGENATDWDLLIVDIDSRDRAINFYQKNRRYLVGMAMTASPRGYHIWTKADKSLNVPSSVSEAYDIRCRKGLSTEPDSKKHVVTPSGTVTKVYEFVPGLEFKGSIESLPEFRPEWIIKPKKEPLKPYRAHDGLAKRVEWARRDIDQIWAEGSNGELEVFKVACILIQRYGLPEEMALHELRVWNCSHADPPAKESVLQYKISESLRLKR